jgi:hypothetical protein
MHASGQMALFMLKFCGYKDGGKRLIGEKHLLVFILLKIIYILKCLKNNSLVFVNRRMSKKHRRIFAFCRRITNICRPKQLVYRNIPLWDLHIFL